MAGSKQCLGRRNSDEMIRIETFRVYVFGFMLCYILVFDYLNKSMGIYQIAFFLSELLSDFAEFQQSWFHYCNCDNFSQKSQDELHGNNESTDTEAETIFFIDFYGHLYFMKFNFKIFFFHISKNNS